MEKDTDITQKVMENQQAKQKQKEHVKHLHAGHVEEIIINLNVHRKLMHVKHGMVNPSRIMVPPNLQRRRIR